MGGSLYTTPNKFQGSIAEGSSPVRKVSYNPTDMKSALKVKQTFMEEFRN
jgi:outer membrane phospholipase A